MINTIKQTLLRKEYKILSRQMEMNVVGIRSNNKEINKFDDRITLFYKDAKGNEQFHSFPATTDPGRRWLLAGYLLVPIALACPIWAFGPFVQEMASISSLSTLTPVRFAKARIIARVSRRLGG